MSLIFQKNRHFDPWISKNFNTLNNNNNNNAESIQYYGSNICFV